jgi:L-lactate utilization protein LutC
MSLITGASTTRDIESIPVVGAHGPREVHIVVVV